MTPVDHERYDDGYIRGILNTVKTIAMVGASAKDNRPSYFAFKYLGERGYNMIPINPGLAGKELLGRKIYARLSEVPEPIDMVDIFRASNYALPVVQEALDGLGTAREPVVHRLEAEEELGDVLEELAAEDAIGELVEGPAGDVDDARATPPTHPVRHGEPAE